MQNQPNYQTQLLTFNLTREHPVRLKQADSLSAAEITYLHWHDCFEISLCLEGSGVSITQSDGIEHIKAGDVQLFAPGTLHYSRSNSESTSKWLWSYFDFSQLLVTHFPEMKLEFLETLSACRFSRLISDGGEFRDLLLNLYNNRNDLCEVRAWSLLIVKRLKRIYDTLPAEKRRLPSSSVSTNSESNVARINKALARLSKHYAAKITIPELALLCGMSENNFRRVFRAAVGTSPQHYLNQFRCAMAKSLLLSDTLSITEIADRCGYPTVSNFNRQFRQHVGTSPRDFRNSY